MADCTSVLHRVPIVGLGNAPTGALFEMWLPAGATVPTTVSAGDPMLGNHSSVVTPRDPRPDCTSAVDAASECAAAQWGAALSAKLAAANVPPLTARITEFVRVPDLVLDSFDPPRLEVIRGPEGPTDVVAVVGPRQWSIQTPKRCQEPTQVFMRPEANGRVLIDAPTGLPTGLPSPQQRAGRVARSRR